MARTQETFTVTLDPAAVRVAALNAAVALTSEHGNRPARHVLATAEVFERWLSRPLPATGLLVAFGTVVDQATFLPTGTVIQGEPMQLHDNEQFDLTVEATDAKGNPVADTLTWTIDNTSVATLNVSADTLTCTVVAGAVGSATITVTDGTLSATEALDVIAGPVAAIKLVEGAVTTQPAA